MPGTPLPTEVQSSTSLNILGIYKGVWVRVSNSFDVLGVGCNEAAVLFPGVEVIIERSNDLSICGKMRVFCN